MTALDWQSPLDPPPPNEEVQVMLYDRAEDDWRVDIGWQDADGVWRYGNSRTRIGALIGGWQPLAAVAAVLDDNSARHWSRTGIAPWHVVVAERRDARRMWLHVADDSVSVGWLLKRMGPAVRLRLLMNLASVASLDALDDPAAIY